MKSLQEIIRAPLISEKGTLLAESANQVLFKVRPDANKIEVKKAVETLFKVKVVQVRMARYLGKMRRIGKNMGRRLRMEEGLRDAQRRRQDRLFRRSIKSRDQTMAIKDVSTHLGRHAFPHRAHFR